MWTWSAGSWSDPFGFLYQVSRSEPSTHISFRRSGVEPELLTFNQPPGSAGDAGSVAAAQWDMRVWNSQGMSTLWSCLAPGHRSQGMTPTGRALHFTVLPTTSVSPFSFSSFRCPSPSSCTFPCWLCCGLSKAKHSVSSHLLKYPLHSWTTISHPLPWFWLSELHAWSPHLDWATQGQSLCPSLLLLSLLGSQILLVMTRRKHIFPHPLQGETHRRQSLL